MSDEWDAIRVLDERENWIERTAVVSKADHEHLLQCAKGILDEVVDTLPIESKEQTHSEQQQFTDEDFQYSAAQFDVDYLEGIASDSVQTSDLTRQSLYVKFDPLVGTNSPKPTNTAMQHVQQSASDDLLVLNTPPALGKKSCLSSHKSAGVSNKKQVHIGTTETFPVSSPLISTAVPVSSEGGPPNSAPSLMDNSPLLRSTSPDSTEVVAGSFTDGPASPPPMAVQDHTSPPTDTLIKVLKYSEEDLTRMKDKARIKVKQEAKNKKEAEIASLRKEIAALKREAKKMQQKDSSIKTGVSTHHNTVTKLEVEVQQYRERVEAHEERVKDVLDHHENCLKDRNTMKERSKLIGDDMNHLENLFEETHRNYLALKNTHKNLSQQTSLLEQRKTQLLQAKEQGSAKIHNLREEVKLQSEEIESKLEQSRRELAAKRSLEKAKQDQLQVQVDSLEKSIEQLEQEKQQLSSMCEELMKSM